MFVAQSRKHLDFLLLTIFCQYGCVQNCYLYSNATMLLEFYFEVM